MTFTTGHVGVAIDGFYDVMSERRSNSSSILVIFQRLSLFIYLFIRKINIQKRQQIKKLKLVC
jgi:hypothetical protein